MRQQLPDLTGPLCWQPRQHIFEIGIRIMPIHARRLDQTHNCSRPFATAQQPGKQTALATECPWPYLVLDLVVVDERIPIVQVGYQRYQTFQAVIESSGHG